MLEWIRRIVGLSPEQQIDAIEEREPTIEERVRRLADRMGSYGHRDARELQEVIADIDAVLDALERILSILDYEAGMDRARSLRRRLKNHRTRAANALARAA
jgi:exonuclease VII small subunit